MSEKKQKLTEAEMIELQNIEAWYDYHGTLSPEKQKRRAELIKKATVKKEK